MGESIFESVLARPDFRMWDTQDSLGRTALHAAAETGRDYLCQLLLDNPKFTKTDATDMKDWTPLHYAAAVGHKYVVEVLLEHPRYDPVDRDGGWTPVHCAQINGDNDMYLKLLRTTGCHLSGDLLTDLTNTPK